MNKFSPVRVAAAAIIGVSGTAFPATAAMALPAGCGQSISAFGQVRGANTELMAQMGGDCDSNRSRTLKGEIKQDLSLRPDPVTLEGADTDSRYYLVALQGCDHNKTATYYARVFFSGHTDYLDSDPKRFDVC